ncbi:MAG: sigma-54-dependent Fis family transcriptional regulator [Bacteroidetes bacterium]|nr:sigma-54-dependent Fis family transcriptional regulator [Bacteroidota bacterium]
MALQDIKNRFGIIGNSAALEYAIDTARQVAPTEISILITGESGVGKEVFPQIIHNLSPRKHGPYIAVNCGAIPEGTIDSELFGHEKGSFTGAHESRKGYFEVANGGTIFLDEVGDLPLGTQVRLLRVLETGEFIKVGSSKVVKTNVRVVAATNVNMMEAMGKGRFREDLYYRLCTIPIFVPSLKQRKEDIALLFRKFAADFSEKYRMPALSLSDEGYSLLMNYDWPGNIRQLKNMTEQISILEKDKNITGETLLRYLPKDRISNLPMLLRDEKSSGDFSNERELIYKILFDMRKEINELKRIVFENGAGPDSQQENDLLPTRLQPIREFTHDLASNDGFTIHNSGDRVTPHVEVQESLSIMDKEKELIIKALQKHRNRRKNAARELGISERTLYRKINEYNIKS